MYYIIPLGLFAYKYRTQLGYYLLRGYSYIEVLYNRWYNQLYVHPDYRLYFNGEEVTTNIQTTLGRDGVYELEYNYRNRVYRIPGKKVEDLLDYLEKIDYYCNEENPATVYKWIMAEDEQGNDILDIVKRYAGPLGDFYKYAQPKEYSEFLPFLNKKITITDFRCDTFELDFSHRIDRVLDLSNP